jgi:hypothetical protein
MKKFSFTHICLMVGALAYALLHFLTDSFGDTHSTDTVWIITNIWIVGFLLANVQQDYSNKEEK